MKEFSSKRFDSKSPLLLATSGLALTAMLATGIVHKIDQAASFSVNKIEIAKPKTKPAPMPNGIRMSKIGKVAFSNDTSETFYACVDSLTNTKTYVISRSVLNSPKDTNTLNYATQMVDRPENQKIISDPQDNIWGIGNNPANAIAQELTVNPKNYNYLTFHGYWHDANTHQVIDKTVTTHLVPGVTVTYC